MFGFPNTLTALEISYADYVRYVYRYSDAGFVTCQLEAYILREANVPNLKPPSTSRIVEISTRGISKEGMNFISQGSAFVLQMDGGE